MNFLLFQLKVSIFNSPHCAIEKTEGFWFPKLNLRGRMAAWLERRRVEASRDVKGFIFSMTIVIVMCIWAINKHCCWLIRLCSEHGLYRLSSEGMIRVSTCAFVLSYILVELLWVNNYLNFWPIFLIQDLFVCMNFLFSSFMAIILNSFQCKY